MTWLGLLVRRAAPSNMSAMGRKRPQGEGPQPARSGCLRIRGRAERPERKIRRNKEMVASFTDAEAKHAMNPATFEAPSADELASVRIGSLVKICADEIEQFWVEVTNVNGDNWMGLSTTICRTPTCIS